MQSLVLNFSLVLKEEENELKRQADQLVAQQPPTVIKPSTGFTALQKSTKRAFSSRYFAKVCEPSFGFRGKIFHSRTALKAA